MKQIVPVAFFVWLLLALAQVGWAQAPAWQQAFDLGQTNSSDYAEIRATATDAAGNVFVAGSFAGGLRLGSTTLSSSSTSLFVAKWSPGSGYVWAQASSSAVASSRVIVGGLAVQGNNIYTTGYMLGSPVTFGSTTVTSPSISSSYVAKLTDAGASGSFGWVHLLNGPNATATELAAQGSNVYVAGNFLGTLLIGSTTLVNQQPQGLETFVAKLSDAGATVSEVWGQRAGGVPQAIAVSGTSVYVAGDFSWATADFGATTLTNTPGSPADAFVAKLSDAGASGSFAWAQAIRGGGYEYAQALAARGNEVYVAGSFGSSVTTLGGLTLTNAQGSTGFAPTDVYVAKLNDAGSTASFTWALRAGGSSTERVDGLALSSASVLLSGVQLSATADYGSYTLPSPGTGGLFVAKVADAGSTAQFAWAQAAATNTSYSGSCVAVSGAQVCVLGCFKGTASFGSHTLTTLATAQSGYLATLTDAALLKAAPAAAALPMTAYPTVAHGSVTVQLPALELAHAVLTLLDALGRPVRRYPAAASGSTQLLDVRGVVPGYYTLRLTAEQGAATQRVVVQ